MGRAVWRGGWTGSGRCGGSGGGARAGRPLESPGTPDLQVGSSAMSRDPRRRPCTSAIFAEFMEPRHDLLGRVPLLIRVVVQALDFLVGHPELGERHLFGRLDR